MIDTLQEIIIVNVIL